MSVPFGSRTTLRTEAETWKALDEHDWLDSTQTAASPVRGRIAWDTPDDLSRTEIFCDDGLGPARGIITAFGIVLVIIGVLWATWDAADWFGLI